MKKWIVTAVITAVGGTAAVLINVPVEQPLGAHAVDVCYIYSVGKQDYTVGQVLAVKPVGSYWTDVEKGMSLSKDTDVKFCVITLDLPEALSNSATADPKAYVIDSITKPTNVVSK
jgi:hypothetical protein